MNASSIPTFEKTDMSWDITPSSLYMVLVSVWDRYQMPIWITESGIADGEEDQTRRIRYMAAVLTVLEELVARGVDLRGYLVWTLLDNFEWAEGFTPRFGLLHTDFETLERTPRHATCDMLGALIQRSAHGKAADGAPAAAGGDDSARQLRSRRRVA